MLVAENVRNYLDSNGIRHSFVAERAKIPKNVFSYIMTGKRKLDSEELGRICIATGTTPNDFIDGPWNEKEEASM